MSEKSINLQNREMKMQLINNTKWENKYRLAREYYNENNHLLVSTQEVYKSVNLGTWIIQQRILERKNKLDKDKINKLSEIGMEWGRIRENSWDELYLLAKEYYDKYNNLFIPYRYNISGRKLGSWITLQRTLHKKGELSKEKIKKLEKIGMAWDVKVKKQTSFPEQAIFYYLKKYFNDCINRYTDLGFELDIYIPSLKLGIEYDGASFHNIKNIKRDLNKNDKCKENYITLIRIREPKCPNLNDGITYTLNKVGNKSYEFAIKFILKYINNTYNFNIDLTDVNINRDSIDIYDMFNNCLDKEWFYKYKLAKEYYNKHKNLLIPQNYLVNDVRLGDWISKQRLNYKNKKISTKYILKLEKIGMVWDIYDVQWEEFYVLAKEYYKTYNNLLISKDFMINNVKLGAWISQQRNRYKINKVSQERIEKLNEIGMVWDKFDMLWEVKYKLAKEYFNKNGHLLVPQNYVINSEKLGTWISMQRMGYKSNKISKERADKLNQINMVW